MQLLSVQSLPQTLIMRSWLRVGDHCTCLCRVDLELIWDRFDQANHRNQRIIRLYIFIQGIHVACTCSPVSEVKTATPPSPRLEDDAFSVSADISSRLCGNPPAFCIRSLHYHASPPSIMSTQDVHSENSLPASKRRRVTRACDNCKSRKRRCNGEKPCAYCTEHRALCTYDAPYTRGKSDNVTAPVSRDAHKSPRGLSQWPHLSRHSVASGSSQNRDKSTSSHSSSPWPRSSLIQPAAAAAAAEDDERTGAQSSRARSPIGGEGAAPMGQYLGPTSPFSVGGFLSSRQSESETSHFIWSCFVPIVQFLAHVASNSTQRRRQTVSELYNPNACTHDRQMHSVEATQGSMSSQRCSSY